MGAAEYERDVIPFIRPFTDRVVASLPPSAGHLLDHGCGTGEVSAALLRSDRCGSALGVDPDLGMITRYRERFVDDRRVQSLHATLSDSIDKLATLPPADLVVSQLVLPFVPDARREL